MRSCGRLIRALVFGALALAAASSFGQSASSAKSVLLGKLGQTLQNATIFASASSRSRSYYRLKPYEYLVLRPSKYSGWTQVLLQNGNYGYIKNDFVTVLPYDVKQTVGTGKTALTQAPPSEANLTSRGLAAQYGTKFTGTPYKWGGNDPLNGIDCSAFVKFLYGKIGIDLPRTAAQQALVGTPIYQLEELKSGDRLYFWDKKRGKIGHTGLYLGNGYFVHSSSTHKGVATDYLGDAKWKSMLVAARR